MYRVPLATYRVQFNAGFTFEDARHIAPYLAELGITDLYASPILKARKGSTHGYDVTDGTSLNPELGSEEQFTALHEKLEELGLGLLLDVVPNHMAASQENSWWMSVLENGPHSRFLHYFDIEWGPVTAKGHTENKVLLPILGKPYGEAIESGEIRLAFDQDGFYFTYFDKRLPLAPKSYGRVLRECVESLPKEGVAIELRDLIEGDQTVRNSRFLKDTLARIYESSTDFRAALDATILSFNGAPGTPDSFNDLDTLLDSQYYRLAYWRIASEKINYRRFFDKIGIRIRRQRIREQPVDPRSAVAPGRQADAVDHDQLWLKSLRARVAIRRGHVACAGQQASGDDQTGHRHSLARAMHGFQSHTLILDEPDHPERRHFRPRPRRRLASLHADEGSRAAAPDSDRAGRGCVALRL